MWIEEKCGNVTIKHHSTLSLIEVIIVWPEQEGQGEAGSGIERMWFDYIGFLNLKKAINQIDFF